MKKDIGRILTDELLSGRITEDDYSEIIEEIKPHISYETYPELRNQALQIAKKEFIKGNIDEEE